MAEIRHHEYVHHYEISFFRPIQPIDRRIQTNIPIVFQRSMNWNSIEHQTSILWHRTHREWVPVQNVDREKSSIHRQSTFEEKKCYMDGDHDEIHWFLNINKISRNCTKSNVYVQENNSIEETKNSRHFVPRLNIPNIFYKWKINWTNRETVLSNPSMQIQINKMNYSAVVWQWCHRRLHTYQLQIQI